MSDIEKEFSEGFMHDIADLLGYCSERKTDKLELNFEYDEFELQVDIAFTVREKEVNE